MSGGIREYKYEYNENGDEVYFRGFNGYKHWKEYDENNNLVHFKNFKGSESWFKWKDNKRAYITQQEFEQIKEKKAEKEFLSREEIPRFDLMEL